MQTEAKIEKVASRYRKIYIHSKLMIIDDAMFTLGSANLNQRSMHTDSEINVASDDYTLATDLRQRVWKLHSTANGQDTDRIKNKYNGVLAQTLAGGDGSQKAIENTFTKWKEISQENLKNKKRGLPIHGYIVKFQDKRTSSIRLA